jgi:triphosphoribosyl-dephospho-CoA synthetase
MAPKPDKHTAVLVQERVQEVLHTNALSSDERDALAAFNQDIDQYLR